MQSQEIGILFEALAKAQGKIQNVATDSKNPHFKSSYASLAAVLETCREALSANGLSITQITEEDEKGTILVTILGHSSGQWLRSTIRINPEKNTAQSFGSALTYYRRYSLVSMCGIHQEDDDGNTASKDQPFNEAIDTLKITEKQAGFFYTKLKNYPDYQKKMFDQYRIKNASEFLRKDFNTVLTLVDKYIASLPKKDIRQHVDNSTDADENTFSNQPWE